MNVIGKDVLLKVSILLFLCCCGTKSLLADNVEELIEQADKLNLSQQTTWLKLLHYENSKSALITESFFLSLLGKNNPKEELDATIRAYFLPWNDEPNKHPRCKFPARYYWLSKKINLPAYNLKDDHCVNLEKWASFDKVKSVSVILVSGYFGNPASTFGHALLKFNTDNPQEGNLLDLTLGYGAAVPENENGILYVMRGLFGGYQAGFSDKYFYTQDMMYTRTEFRDMWDYELSMTEEQRILLMLHIWEVVGNKFNYYFLKKNCAYRLAEFIEMVTNKNLTRNGLFWYLPVELFYRLEQAGLVKSIKYVPSNQRILYYQLKRLSLFELSIFNKIVQKGPSVIRKELNQLNVEQEQIKLLESLIAYHEYRLASEVISHKKEQEELKNEILLARLDLPAQERPAIKIKKLSSPAKGSRPMTLGFGMGVTPREQNYLRLSWSPFKQEMVGQNSLEGDEFVVLNLSAGFMQDGRHIFLDQVDLVKILKLNTLSVSVADENLWSWQLRLGMDKVDRNEEGKYDGIGIFGLGRGKSLRENIIVYGMLDIAGHTLSPYARLRPHAGIRIDMNKIRAWLYRGFESSDYKGKFHDIWGGKIQYQFDKRWSLFVEMTNEKACFANVGLNYYW